MGSVSFRTVGLEQQGKEEPQRDRLLVLYFLSWEAGIPFFLKNILYIHICYMYSFVYMTYFKI